MAMIMCHLSQSPTATATDPPPDSSPGTVHVIYTSQPMLPPVHIILINFEHLFYKMDLRSIAFRVASHSTATAAPPPRDADLDRGQKTFCTV